MNRKTIQLKIKTNEFKIKELQLANDKLIKDNYLFSDKKQWFIEKIESVSKINGKKNEKVDVLIGTVHWNQDHTDADTGQVISIERSKRVRINGEWNL